ncbi:MAG TPA: aminoglycoside phosphotransferase family protein [Ktedonobacteraceae bacterium]|nr:aminoglycoside phosphotransferase family protein [Ktedonobacteraceae bacterium]
MREQPNIPDELLQATLQEQYDIVSVTLEFLPRGLDYDSWVYRVMSEQGASYLLKARSGLLYEPSCLIPSYLRDQGIASVVAPLPTKNNALWTRAEAWTVIVYPFIEGDTSLTGMTDEQWQEAGATFKRIHEVAVPAEGFELLRKETFDVAEYARWIRAFETRHMYSAGGSVPERALRSSWVAHQSTIHMAVNSLEKLAGMLQRQSSPFVICHADLHPANLIRDHSGHVFVIDWNDVMLALKERDFIFVWEPRANAFWEGYGHPEVNWVALTYYRWERVVQDLIECARDVFFKDDWGEESRVDAARLFDEILVGRGSIDAAYAAAAHLPPDLV